MANRKISYATRDYQAIRTELLNYVRTYYPELIQDFNDASVFSVFLDLNAAVADNLNYNIDRSIQETVLQYAQQRSSVYNIARTYGLKVPGQRPSVSLVDFSITVPAFGDKEDERYLGVLTRGSQVVGAGIVFENIHDIDFASPYNSQGFPNRLKIPNFNANNVLINYTITKRELVVNGITKVFKRVITPNDVKPFFELFLPEKNVLGITSVLLKNGTEYTNVPSVAEFLGAQNRWYEVDTLAEDRIFVEDPTKVSDQPGIKVGRYLQTANRFISEFTAEGFKKMTFGGGTNTAQDALNEFTTLGVTADIQRYSNNISLGSTLSPNSIKSIGLYSSPNGFVSPVGAICTDDWMAPSTLASSSISSSTPVPSSSKVVGLSAGVKGVILSSFCSTTSSADNSSAVSIALYHPIKILLASQTLKSVN